VNNPFIAITLLLAFVSANANAQKVDADDISITKNYIEKAGLDAYVDLQIKEARKILPLQSNNLEYLAGITYLKEHKTQIFRHVTLPGWAESVAKNSGMSPTQVKSVLPDVMQEQSVNLACSVEVTRFMLDRGLKIKHNYYESDGTFMFSTEVLAKDCR
jgi:hypothetical protein